MSRRHGVTELDGMKRGKRASVPGRQAPPTHVLGTCSRHSVTHTHSVPQAVCAHSVCPRSGAVLQDKVCKEATPRPWPLLRLSSWTSIALSSAGHGRSRRGALGLWGVPTGPETRGVMTRLALREKLRPVRLSRYRKLSVRVAPEPPAN